MRLEIRIGVDSIAPQQIRLALLRELVSAVSVNYRAADYELPEPLVGSLASGLFQVLRDNPAVTAFILGEEPQPGGSDPWRPTPNEIQDTDAYAELFQPRGVEDLESALAMRRRRRRLPRCRRPGDKGDALSVKG